MVANMRYSDFASSAPKNGKKKQSNYNYSTIKAKDTNPNIKKDYANKPAKSQYSGSKVQTTIRQTEKFKPDSYKTITAKDSPKKEKSSSVKGGGYASKTTKAKKPSMKFSSGKIKVKSGMTLSGIARANNTTVQALKRENNIKNVDMIRVGQTIKAPSKKNFKVTKTGIRPA